eukprot:GHVN01086615.1.p1 GENE.GHVN01086615.1~~GHVN01086615.1.p1  ORF type:complete len:138 (+),score=24.21 GHVN01086615.1:330-743(+)
MHVVEITLKVTLARTNLIEAPGCDEGKLRQYSPRRSFERRRMGSQVLSFFADLAENKGAAGDGDGDADEEEDEEEDEDDSDGQRFRLRKTGEGIQKGHFPFGGLGELDLSRRVNEIRKRNEEMLSYSNQSAKSPKTI